MLKPLSLADLPDIMGLQNAVWEDLKLAGKTRFIMPRGEDYFISHLETPHKIIGMHDESGRLIAQAIHHNAYPFNVKKETGLDSLPNMLETDYVTTLQGALVHPLNRKQGLMGKLIEDWLQQSANMRFALARVEVSHEASHAAFAKFGFEIVGMVPDARDDASVHVLLKQL